jgi:endo-alpha-1,4-polygalactosaminidase (GH114 family)
LRETRNYLRIRIDIALTGCTSCASCGSPSGARLFAAWPAVWVGTFPMGQPFLPFPLEPGRWHDPTGPLVRAGSDEIALGQVAIADRHGTWRTRGSFGGTERLSPRVQARNPFRSSRKGDRDGLTELQGHAIVGPYVGSHREHLMNRRMRHALLYLVTAALLVTMTAAPASAAKPNPDDPTAALKGEINELYASGPGVVGRAHKMQAFIMELALHAKARNPDFKIIPQDAAQLAYVDADVSKGKLGSLVSLVDGWGKEGLLLSGDGTTPTNEQRAYLGLVDSGLMVSETSTVNSTMQLQEYYRRAANWGIIPYPRIGGTLAQQLFPGKRWATNGDYFWVENPATIGLGDRIDGSRNVVDLTDARNYLYNINGRPYDAWSTWDDEEAAALADGEADRTRITDSYGNGLLVPSAGGPYQPAGNAATVQNAIALYGDEWDWWWRAAGLDENAGRDTWLNALRDSDYDVIYIDSFYNHRALPDNQTPLTRAEIESLKYKPDGGRRQVIAYLSVGSAEQNRWYCQDDWAWIDPTNPNTERSMKAGKIVSGVYTPPEGAPAWLAMGYGGNYAEEAVVQWWNPEWRDIIIYGGTPYANVATGDNTSSIDRIISQGFDGAYLDNVGVYSRSGWNAFETYWLAQGGMPGDDSPYLPVSNVSPGNQEANLDFGIASASGKGYSVYLKAADAIGPFTRYANVNFNSQGVHIKGLANGTQYLAYLQYEAGGTTSRTETLVFTPR